MKGTLSALLSQRLVTKKFSSFIVVCLALLPFLSLFATGPVKSSIDNAEHWVNLTNAMFINGQNFIFSYGPLFWLVGGVSEYYNTSTYYISIMFVWGIYAVIVWATLLLMYKSRGYLFFLLIAVCFFSFYYLKVLIFLWPLVFLFYRQFSESKQYYINVSVCLLFGVLAGFVLYIRFFYGLITIAVFGGYLAAQFLRDFRLKQTVCFIISFAVSSFVIGILVYGDANLVLKYFTTNIQLSYGNGVDMTLDIINYPFAYVCSFIVLGCFIAYGIFKRQLFILPLLVTWLLLFKLGFGRADHYVTYFVVPCAFIMLLISFDKGKFVKGLFFISFFSLYYLGTHSAYQNSPKLGLAFSTINIPSMNNPFKLPFAAGMSYQDRMAQDYEQYKLDDDFVREIGESTIDVYPYNNEYMYANKLNYKPRPLFQNYMTLTPALDLANAEFLNSPEKPQKILWNGGLACGSVDCNTFTGVDNKFLLNEDPLTSMAILENYSPSGFVLGRNDEPMLLFSARDQKQVANFVLKKSERMKFGMWYPVPEAKQNIVKIYPDFKITTIGKLKNFFFRGNIVKISYKLKSGEQRQYRLNIINAQSGVWASPLLDGLEPLGFSGEDVAEVMFETDSDYYFEPEFEAKFVATETPLITYQRRKINYNEPVTLPATVRSTDIDCEGSIDQAIDPIRGEDYSLPLSVKGWLAKSTAQGVLFDAIYVTLADKNHHKRYFTSNRNNRGDLVAVFGREELNNAGFISTIDTSSLDGEFSVTLAGRTGDETFICRNLQRPLNINRN